PHLPLLQHCYLLHGGPSPCNHRAHVFSSCCVLYQLMDGGSPRRIVLATLETAREWIEKSQQSRNLPIRFPNPASTAQVSIRRLPWEDHGMGCLLVSWSLRPICLCWLG